MALHSINIYLQIKASPYPAYSTRWNKQFCYSYDLVIHFARLVVMLKMVKYNKIYTFYKNLLFIQVKFLVNNRV